jgi:hypothetical protein
MIKWKPAQDRIIEGEGDGHRFFIKLTKEGKVISLYTIFLGDTDKQLAEDLFEEIEEAKLQAEITLETGRKKLETLKKLEV